MPPPPRTWDESPNLPPPLLAATHHAPRCPGAVELRPVPSTAPSACSGFCDVKSGLKAPPLQAKHSYSQINRWRGRAINSAQLVPIETKMSLSRRFMNLIVDNRFSGAKSLRCIDLRHLFDATTPPTSTTGDGSESALVQDPSAHITATALKMERLQLPSPIFTFKTKASPLNDPLEKIQCLPLADGKTFWSEHHQLGRSFVLDLEKGCWEFICGHHKPKRMPFSLFVPNTKGDNSNDCDDLGSCLFIMERNPEPEANCSMQESYQFEALVYRQPNRTTPYKTWIWQPVPPPPFLRRPTYQHIRPYISSYGVVGGGKLVCISVDGVGSYCLNMENHTWSEIGKWTLPFRGKVEYVPELKLWFGLSAEGHQLAAADLSVLDSQPQLVTMKQLDVPDEWKEYKDSQLVNLGSGLLCIARFFHPMTPSKDLGDDSGQCFTVFSGVEVLPLVHDANCNGSIDGEELELQMILRKSICHISNGTSIDAVF